MQQTTAYKVGYILGTIAGNVVTVYFSLFLLEKSGLISGVLL